LKINSVLCTSAKESISLNSAAAGTHLTLSALDIGENYGIITPSFTFASTVNIIALRWAIPVFVDINNYSTLNINPELIEEAITRNTKVIIPVHFAGALVNMDKINELA
jgi:UDP-4-amino-4-deoxy-L-arabinose-oxoglutarate aminotransferase